jgi:hypothetical protein
MNPDALAALLAEQTNGWLRMPLWLALLLLGMACWGGGYAQGLHAGQHLMKVPNQEQHP